MKLFLRRLQLATSIPIDSTILTIQLLDPELLSDGQVHGIRVPNLLQNCHRHVRHFVARAIEMGPDSFLQIGPRLPVSPSHADPVLVHPGPKLRYRFPSLQLNFIDFFD